MSINYCPSCYTDELLNYYPFLNSVNIYVADDEDFDALGLSDALAATDVKNKIIVRKNLPPRIFRHALFHECEHFIHSLYASESEVDIDARKKSGFNYRVSAYGTEFKTDLKSVLKLDERKIHDYVV